MFGKPCIAVILSPETTGCVTLVRTSRKKMQTLNLDLSSGEKYSFFFHILAPETAVIKCNLRTKTPLDADFLSVNARERL